MEPNQLQGIHEMFGIQKQLEKENAALKKENANLQIKIDVIKDMNPLQFNDELLDRYSALVRENAELKEKLTIAGWNCGGFQDKAKELLDENQVLKKQLAVSGWHTADELSTEEIADYEVFVSMNPGSKEFFHYRTAQAVINHISQNKAANGKFTKFPKKILFWREITLPTINK